MISLSLSLYSILELTPVCVCVCVLVSGSEYVCTLSPTCCSPRSPLKFNDLISYQLHYKTFHTFICQQQQQQTLQQGQGEVQVCGRIFPNEKLLNLHFKECHDPITKELRDNRGEKTFECLHYNSTSTGEETCCQKFSNPKNRRLHMIFFHGYPKEWFFNVVVWGINKLILNDDDNDNDNDHDESRGGYYHGMVRKDWKPRKGQPGFNDRVRDKDKEKANDQDQDEEGDDLEMEDLIGKFKGSSIGFLPRSVAVAQKQRQKQKKEIVIEESVT